MSNGIKNVPGYNRPPYKTYLPPSPKNSFTRRAARSLDRPVSSSPVITPILSLVKPTHFKKLGCTISILTQDLL